MPNVVRFALSTARTLHVPGAGTFIAGILDVDANNLALLTKTRYLVQPYRAVELGTVDATTPKPSLPAVPGPPSPDPYPQYLTPVEAASSPELRAAFETVYRVEGPADLQVKVDAAVATGGVVLLPYGSLPPTAAISVPSNLTKRIVIRGRGIDSTTVVLSATAKSLVSMARTNGAGSILRNVTVEDLTVDASALVAGTASAASWGIIGAANPADVSWSDITVRRVKGIGGPVNPSIANQFFWVYVMSRVDTAATLRTIERITVEDFDFTGGENGVYIGGQRLSTGAADYSNVTLDDIACRRGRHVMPTPTGFLASNNFIFGHRGRGKKLRVADLYGYGCGDAGLEVNAWDDAVVERCTIEDAYNSDFYHTHYNTAPTPSAQRLVYRDCTAKRTAYTPSAFVAQVGQSYGWLQAASTFATPAPSRLERCAFVKTTADLTVEGAALLSYSSRGVVIDDFVSDESGIAYDANTTASAAIQVRSAAGVTVPVRMRRVRVRVAGAKGTGADRLWTAVRFPFGGYVLDLDDIAVDFGITGGVSPVSCRAIYLGDDSSTATLKGSVRRARFDGSTDPSAWLIVVGPTTTTAIQPKILIEDCDVRLPGDTNATTVSRTLVQFRGSAGQQNNTGGVIIRNSTPGNAKWPATRVTIAPGASPFAYQNLDGIPQRVIVNGGVVSSVSWSQDGTEWFDVGSTTAGMFRLEPGDYLRVTYSGLPSMFKVFDR